MIASTVPRSSCTSARAAADVIHLLVPSAAALRPSRVAANFQMTYGRPRRSRSASNAGRGGLRPRVPRLRPRRRPIAGALDARRPRADWGRGPRPPRRAIPAAISASEQGPVRPVWLQGSSVTTAVPPRARSPASRSARISACGPPADVDVRRRPPGRRRPAGRRRRSGWGWWCRDRWRLARSRDPSRPVRGSVPWPAPSPSTRVGAWRGFSASGAAPVRAAPDSGTHVRSPTIGRSNRTSAVESIRCRALSPIRTMTVGPGFAPDPPTAGCGRVAG